jgi:hypothetical protein
MTSAPANTSQKGPFSSALSQKCPKDARERTLLALASAASAGDAKAAAFLPFYLGWLRQQRAS